MNAKHVLSKCLSIVTSSIHRTHKTLRFSLFAAIESSMNGGSLSITGLGRCRPQMTLVAAGHKSKKKTPGFRLKSITGMT
jgi:hypothetical protein